MIWRECGLNELDQKILRTPIKDGRKSYADVVCELGIFRVHAREHIKRCDGRGCLNPPPVRLDDGRIYAQ